MAVLERIQIAFLVGLGTVALALSTVIGLSISSAFGAYQQGTQLRHKISMLRDGGRMLESDSYRYRLEGNGGAIPGFERKLRTMRDDVTGTKDPMVAANLAESLSREEAVRLYDGVIALARIAPEGVAFGSQKDKLAFELSKGLTKSLDAATLRWGNLVIARADRETQSARSRIVMLTAVLIAAVAIIVVSALALALVLRRLRRRVAERLSATAQRLSRMSATDSLTGLANHRAFHELLIAEASSVNAGDCQDLSLALIDIDHFKLINDTRGHPLGDRVLVHLGQWLAEMCGEAEMIARVGGEEFAWVMPGVTLVEATAVVERTRVAIAGKSVDGLPSVTISAGVAHHLAGESPDWLVERADDALYAAKAAGRDAVFADASDSSSLPSPRGRDRSEQSLSLAFIRSLARAVDAKDPLTQRHSERVADLAAAIAEQLDWPAERTSQLRQAALVHDIGKIGVSDQILMKPGRLTAEEYAEVKRHPEVGAQIVSGVMAEKQVRWVRHHHERWDGQGYPAMLAGDAIPRGARILAVADAYDAMTVARPYGTPLSSDEALDEIARGAGAQFCPTMAAALFALAQTSALTLFDDGSSCSASDQSLVVPRTEALVPSRHVTPSLSSGN